MSPLTISLLISLYLLLLFHVPMLSAASLPYCGQNYSSMPPCVHPHKRAETVDRGRLRSRQQSHGGVRKGRNLGTGFAISKGIFGSSSVFSLWLSYRKTMHARIMEMWITRAS